MLVLNLSRAPEWIDVIGGVRLQVAPLTSAVMLAVRSDLAQLDGAKLDVHGRHAAFVQAVARHTILDWEGVAGPEGGPMPVTPDAVDALLDLNRIFDAFSAKVVEPYLLVQSEKNASAPSPNGTSAAAETTAAPAKASARSAPVN